MIIYQYLLQTIGGVVVVTVHAGPWPFWLKAWTSLLSHRPNLFMGEVVVAGQCLSRPSEIAFEESTGSAGLLVFLVLGTFLAGFISGAVWVWCLVGKPRVPLPRSFSPPRVGVSDFAALSPVR